MSTMPDEFPEGFRQYMYDYVEAHPPRRVYVYFQQIADVIKAAPDWVEPDVNYSSHHPNVDYSSHESAGKSYSWLWGEPNVYREGVMVDEDVFRAHLPDAKLFPSQHGDYLVWDDS